VSVRSDGSQRSSRDVGSTVHVEGCFADSTVVGDRSTGSGTATDFMQPARGCDNVINRHTGVEEGIVMSLTRDDAVVGRASGDQPRPGVQEQALVPDADRTEKDAPEVNFVVDLPVDLLMGGGDAGLGPTAPLNHIATTVSPLEVTDVVPPRVSVVIPTYNEAKNLPHVLGSMPADLHEIIVVDGNSLDGTVEVARTLRPDATIVLQNRRGKGNAMACGFAAATGDIVVMLDADGSADPLEIPLFVAALTNGADFAKGTRFAQGGGSEDITRLRSWGNSWLNRITNVLFGTAYTDLCYGYNAFWRHCLDHLELDPRAGEAGGRLWGDGFEIETIINTRMAKARMRIVEVPSFEHSRRYGQSNLRTWRDGTRVLRALVVERFSPRGRGTPIPQPGTDPVEPAAYRPPVPRGEGPALSA
jgi:hypothetical protein